jgi:RHS repeat-associated protein
VREAVGETPTDYTYTGQRSEAALGLMYYVARWYDPHIAHFVQADTIVPGAGNPAAWDRYAYVFNNPLRFTDASGHIPDEEKQWYIDRTVIIHVRIPNAKPGVDFADRSLGTILSPNCVYTHDHFSSPDISSQEVTFFFGDGLMIQPERVAFEHIGPRFTFWESNYQTQSSYIWSSDSFGEDEALISSIMNFSSLNIGMSVEVVFYNNDLDLLDVVSLPVVSLNNCYIVLEDADFMINHGDSGGGVFFNRKLIGNSWAIFSNFPYGSNEYSSSQYVWVALHPDLIIPRYQDKSMPKIK